MSEEQIKTILGDFRQALNKKDIEKVVSFFAEDATIVAPVGIFKGNEEIKRYFTRLFQSFPDLTVTDAGIGIIVQGNKAVREHVLEATSEGVKWSVPGTGVYEFSDEKIQHHRSFHDRLSIAKQAAKGWFAKRMVNSIVKRADRGLR